MRWSDGFVAVDWGTTNRRAYAFRADGALTDTLEDGLGILKVTAGGFDAAIAELRQRFGDVPILLAGMVGSNRGWVEAPYVACPAGLDQIAGSLRWIDESCCIVPGVCSAPDDTPDVMRGEETQILGTGSLPPGATVCLPGTHTKWALLGEGGIARFRTTMAGELFGYLKSGSILADQLQGTIEPDDVFRNGVAHALERDDMLAELFSIRAKFVLGGDNAGAAYASGLLIGSDVRIGLGLSEGRVVALVGRPDLTALYAAALDVAGAETVRIDGAAAFQAGAKAIAGRL